MGEKTSLTKGLERVTGVQSDRLTQKLLNFPALVRRAYAIKGLAGVKQLVKQADYSVSDDEATKVADSVIRGVFGSYTEADAYGSWRGTGGKYSDMLAQISQPKGGSENFTNVALPGQPPGKISAVPGISGDYRATGDTSGRGRARTIGPPESREQGDGSTGFYDTNKVPYSDAVYQRSGIAGTPSPSSQLSGREISRRSRGLTAEEAKIQQYGSEAAMRWTQGTHLPGNVSPGQGITPSQYRGGRKVTWERETRTFPSTAVGGAEAKAFTNLDRASRIAKSAGLNLSKNKYHDDEVAGVRPSRSTVGPQLPGVGKTDDEEGLVGWQTRAAFNEAEEEARRQEEEVAAAQAGYVQREDTSYGADFTPPATNIPSDQAQDPAEAIGWSGTSDDQGNVWDSDTDSDSANRTTELLLSARQALDNLHKTKGRVYRWEEEDDEDDEEDENDEDEVALKRYVRQLKRKKEEDEDGLGDDDDAKKRFKFEEGESDEAEEAKRDEAEAEELDERARKEDEVARREDAEGRREAAMTHRNIAKDLRAYAMSKRQKHYKTLTW